MAYRVIQWSTGTMGKMAINQIRENPNFELVGLRVYSEDKVGIDAGVLADGDPMGVKATMDVEALLALDADCVIFSPRDKCVDPLVPGTNSHDNFLESLRILESGKNIVSPHTAATHYDHLSNPQEFLDRINAACAKGNSSIIYAGIDPGYFTDQMAMTLAAGCGTVHKISTWEILDYETIPVPNMLGDRGFGKRLDEIDDSQIAEAIRLLWGGAAHLNAATFGVTLDDIEIEIDHWLSPADMTGVAGFEVRAGTVGAHYFKVKALHGGKPFWIMHHVTRMGPDSGPDWPRIGKEGGYRVDVDATLPMSVDFPLGGGPSGQGCVDAYIVTVSLLINRIPAIVSAEPGYRTYRDLKALTPNHVVLE